MTYLPIDYYILLQTGYADKKAGPPCKTNMLMFNNLPVLNKKQTFYNQNNKIIKAVTWEDIHRGLEKEQSKNLLLDSFAEEELKRLLQTYYEGHIDQLHFINYFPDRIAQSFHMPSG